MFTARLRKVGGSVMVALPSAFVEAMDTKIGGKVEMELHGNILSIKSTKPKYVLADLLAKCAPTMPWTSEEREWLDSPPVENELL
jgi:antitoxin ChpS